MSMQYLCNGRGAFALPTQGRGCGSLGPANWVATLRGSALHEDRFLASGDPDFVGSLVSTASCQGGPPFVGSSLFVGPVGGLGGFGPPNLLTLGARCPEPLCCSANGSCSLTLPLDVRSWLRRGRMVVSGGWPVAGRRRGAWLAFAICA